MNKDFFSKIDTEGKAYWAGFIAADGCLRYSFYHITLKIKDKEHLEKFANLIGIAIRQEITKLNEKIYKEWKVTICSKQMWNDLIKLNIKPRKSLTLKPPKNIPAEFIRDFIRGYFDGNGCISTYKINHPRVMFYGSKFFLFWVKEKLEKLVQIKAPKIKLDKLNGSVYELRYNGYPNTKKICEYFYKNVTIFLERKYKKFNSFMPENFHCRRWLKEEIDYLKNNWRLGDRVISQKLKRKQKAILAKRNSLGIKYYISKYPYRLWTIKETNFLKKNRDLKNKQVAISLGRTIQAVKLKKVSLFKNERG